MNNIKAFEETVLHIKKKYRVYNKTLYLSFIQWDNNLPKETFGYSIYLDGCKINHIEFYTAANALTVSVEILTNNERIIKDIIE